MLTAKVPVILLNLGRATPAVEVVSAEVDSAVKVMEVESAVEVMEVESAVEVMEVVVVVAVGVDSVAEVAKVLPVHDWRTIETPSRI